jgi:ABC-type Zn uptake system ZnuABC Zn-binding protein ZnuA
MTMRRLACPLLALTALAAAALPGCGPAEESWHAAPRVVATFAPLDNFARNVLGDHGQVICLCTEDGVRHYAPSGRDARVLRHADVVFANGLGLDDAFVEKARVNSANPALEGASGRVVKLGDGLPKVKATSAGDGDIDPHVWLGVSQAEGMVSEIRDKLKEVDKDHAADYDANARAYQEALRKDVRDYWEELRKGKKNPGAVIVHESLRWFAADFAPDADVAPSGKRVAEIVKQGGRVVAVRPQYPVDAAKAFEEGLKKRGLKTFEVAEIDPLENAKASDLNDRDWYKNKMRENLDKLAVALENAVK